MAITHTTAVRDSLCNLVVDNLDAGGNLRYQTSGDVTVADGALSAPAFGASSSGTATANAIGDATNSGANATVAKFAMRSATLDIFFGSVTTSGGGGDIIISNTTVNNGEAIQTNSFTYTAAP